MLRLVNKINTLLIVLFIASMLPLFMKVTVNTFRIEDETDVFDPNLSKLNSLEKVIVYTDQRYYKDRTQSEVDTNDYVELLSNVIKERFQLGVSSYNFTDNWIAFLSGKIIWPHLSAIVIPDDILKHKFGLCSQQTIIFMEVLKQKGISVRSVGLGYPEGPGHFLCEVRYGGSWHLHDVSLEPDWSNLASQNKSLDYYLQHKDSLFMVYKHKVPIETFNKLTERVSYGEVNVSPAKNMRFFHRASQALTYLLPFVFGFMLVLSLWKGRTAFSSDRKNKNVE